MRLVNIGDSKSLAAIPADTTHRQLNDKELADAGIPVGTVRLSIGLEDPDDLIDDLKQALDSAFLKQYESDIIQNLCFNLSF